MSLPTVAVRRSALESAISNLESVVQNLETILASEECHGNSKSMLEHVRSLVDTTTTILKHEEGVPSPVVEAGVWSPDSTGIVITNENGGLVELQDDGEAKSSEDAASPFNQVQDEDLAQWLKQTYTDVYHRENTGFDVRLRSMSINPATAVSPRACDDDDEDNLPRTNSIRVSNNASQFLDLGSSTITATRYTRSSTRSFPASRPTKKVHSLLARDSIPILESVNDPDFDVFEVHGKYGNSTLPVVGMNVFMQYNFVSSLQLDVAKLSVFFQTVANFYRADNPYHNQIHAADVLQTAHVYLCVGEVRENFSDVELLAVLFSALVHDVGHIGMNNNFLIKARHPLARIFNDCSPSESMHCSLAFNILDRPECNFFAKSRTWTRGHYDDFRNLVAEVVMGTDMKYHSDLTKLVVGIMEDGQIDDDEVGGLFKAIVHAADLSNPMKPPHLYREWADRVLAEFWKQGDEEARRNMPISMMCDRSTTNVGKSQVGFINFVVKPFMKELGSVLPPIWIERLAENCATMENMDADLESERRAHIEELASKKWKDIDAEDPFSYLSVLREEIACLLPDEGLLSPGEMANTRRLVCVLKQDNSTIPIPTAVRMVHDVTRLAMSFSSYSPSPYLDRAFLVRSAGPFSNEDDPMMLINCDTLIEKCDSLINSSSSERRSRFLSHCQQWVRCALFLESERRRIMRREAQPVGTGMGIVEARRISLPTLTMAEASLNTFPSSTEQPHGFGDALVGHRVLKDKNFDFEQSAIESFTRDVETCGDVVVSLLQRYNKRSKRALRIREEAKSKESSRLREHRTSVSISFLTTVDYCSTGSRKSSISSVSSSPHISPRPPHTTSDSDASSPTGSFRKAKTTNDSDGNLASKVSFVPEGKSEGASPEKSKTTYQPKTDIACLLEDVDREYLTATATAQWVMWFFAAAKNDHETDEEGSEEEDDVRASPIRINSDELDEDVLDEEDEPAEVLFPSDALDEEATEKDHHHHQIGKLPSAIENGRASSANSMNSSTTYSLKHIGRSISVPPMSNTSLPSFPSITPTSNYNINGKSKDLGSDSHSCESPPLAPLRNSTLSRTQFSSLRPLSVRSRQGDTVVQSYSMRTRPLFERVGNSRETSTPTRPLLWESKLQDPKEIGTK